MLRSLEAILRNCISRLDAAEKKAKTDAVREREMAKIRAMLNEGRGVKATAESLGVSPQKIYRALKGHRAGGRQVRKPLGLCNEWLTKPIVRASHE